MEFSNRFGLDFGCFVYIVRQKRLEGLSSSLSMQIDRIQPDTGEEQSLKYGLVGVDWPTIGPCCKVRGPGRCASLRKEETLLSVS